MSFAAIERILGALSRAEAKGVSDGVTRSIRMGWIILTAIGLGYALWRLRDEISLYFTQISPALAAGSIALALIGKIIVFVQVRDSLLAIGHPVSAFDALKLYSYADIAKYAPGGVWGVVSRAGLYRLRGLPVKTIGRALALDHIWLIGSAFVVGGCLFATGMTISLEWSASCLLLTILVSLVALPAWGFVLYKVHPHIAEGPASPREISGYVVKQLAAWTCIGLSFGILIEPLQAQHVSAYSANAGAFAIAFGFGFMAFFAPAGVGVRELAVITLLLPVHSADTIVSASVMSRVLLLASDLLLFALVWTLSRLAQRSAISEKTDDTLPD